MRGEPIVELPQNPTRAEVLRAAISADNHADRLKVEEERWRSMGRALFSRADAMRDRERQVREP